MISVQQLREISQSDKIKKHISSKSNVGLIWLGYTFHRCISIYITYFIIRFFPNCTANFVSFCMLICTLTGAGLLFFQHIHLQLAGVLVCYFAFLLDKVDGELARYKQSFTLRGCYLDEWYHVLAPTSLLCGVFLIPSYEHGLSATMVLIVAAVFSVVRRFERKWYLMVAGKQKKQIDLSVQDRSERKRTLLQHCLNSPILKVAGIVERYDLLLLAVCLALLASEFFSSHLPLLYLLLGYTVLSITYSVRFAFINYFGRFEKLIREFNRYGY